jgi:tetratricopeptide (TPR) repeat protein
VAGLVVAAVWPGAIAALLDALPGPSAVGSRTELWRNGLTLVRDYPFTGLGLDGFMMAYSTYVMLLHVGFAPHAHNLYLDVAIEQGLPALLLLLAMAAVFFRAFPAHSAGRGAGWREETGSAAPERRGQVAAAASPRTRDAVAAFSLLVILLQGLVDDPLYKSRAVLFLFIPLAFAGTLPHTLDGERQRPRRWSSLALALGIIMLVGVALVWRGPLLSQVASNSAAVQQSRAELGVYHWPEWPVQDEVRRQRDLGPVVALYHRALALDPGNASANRRLGQIELSLGEYAAALGHLQAAYAAEPSSNTTRQLLGEAYLANGQRQEGQMLWSGVSNEQGQLDIRVWWYDYIGEKERAEWMRWAAASQR